MKTMEGFIYREINLKRVSIGAFLAQLVNPVIYIVFYATSMTNLLSSITYKGQNLSYFVYVLPGLCSLQAFLVFPFVGSLVASDKRFGLIRTFFISKGTPLKYVFAKTLVEGVVVFGECLLMLTIGFAFCGFWPSLTHASLMFAMLGISFLFWLSLGIIFGLFVRKELTRAAILTLTNLPLLFTSPMFYTLEAAPDWVSLTALANPLKYHVDAVRDSMIGAVTLPTVFVALVMTVVALSISCILLKRATVTPEG